MMQNNFKIFSVLLFGLSISVAGYSKGQSSFDKNLAKTIDICEEIAFPNTQARPPGFDQDANLKKLETDRKKMSKKFHSSAGLQFLKAKLATEKDELKVSCINKLIDENK